MSYVAALRQGILAAEPAWHRFESRPATAGILGPWVVVGVISMHMHPHDRDKMLQLQITRKQIVAKNQLHNTLSAPLLLRWFQGGCLLANV